MCPCVNTHLKSKSFSTSISVEELDEAYILLVNIITRLHCIHKKRRKKKKVASRLDGIESPNPHLVQPVLPVVWMNTGIVDTA